MASNTRNQKETTANATLSVEREPRTILTSLGVADMIDGVLHFIPCSVTEDEAGYTPMGKPRNGMMGERTIADPAPWYWGNTNEACQAICDDYNRENFGIEPKEAMLIVASSIRAQGKYKKWVRDYAPDVYKMMQA